MVEESKEQSRTRNKRCPLSVCELRAAVWQRPSTSGAGHVTVLAAEVTVRRLVRFQKGILNSIQFRFRLTAPYCGQLGAEILSTGVTEEETLLTANRMFTRSGNRIAKALELTMRLGFPSESMILFYCLRSPPYSILFETPTFRKPFLDTDIPFHS
ncbi:LOW QUALITY PROTEIN: hypothetical protein V1478_002945 [Vespula squamosa]|uniref:Uncharacterized protein n=1 Tax=Vespula squamosa TaxID=30214 RepID=A0ABD2BR99_VESSQ